MDAFASIATTAVCTLKASLALLGVVAVLGWEWHRLIAQSVDAS